MREILRQVKRILYRIFTKYYKKIRKSGDIPLFDEKGFLQYVAKKKKGLEVNKAKISAIALRGSVADYGFYANCKDGLYNLGLTSSDLYTSYQLYKKLSPDLTDLEYVYLFLGAMSPGFSLIKTKEKYRAVAYKYFFDVDYQENEEIDPKLENKILKKCNKIKVKNTDADYRGYEKKKYYGAHLKAEERVATHIRENQREPDQMEWIERLAELAKDNGHRLVLVLAPFRSDYRALLPETEELFEKFYALEADVWKIINFYDSPLFDDSDLGDTDHLNEKGAIKMTNELLRLSV